MAPKQMVVVLVIVATLLLAMTMAAEYVVGDNNGWNLGVNYMTWAEDKEFKVGDRIVFKYTPGDHNVIEVGESDFNSCNVPAEASARTTGNDAITLKNAGKKWYVCGKGNHCTAGQRLAISVLPIIIIRPGLPAPAASPFGPPTPNSSNKVYISKYQILKAAMLLMVVIIMV